MNRRNFFGTVGAVIAGAVLGRNVEAMPEKASLTFSRNNGLRLFSADDLHVRTFVADEVRINPGTVYWDDVHDFSNVQLSSLDSQVAFEQDGFGGASVDRTNGLRSYNTQIDFEWHSAWL